MRTRMPGVRSATIGALLAPLLLSACSLGESTPATAAETTTQATTAEEPLEVPPPERFRVEAGTFRATLRWDPSSSGPPLEQYDVYRDGRLVTSLPGDATQYVDATVEPRKKYRWEILARAGDRKSDRVAAAARMKAPPLAQARVEGDFSLTLKVTSHSGYQSIGGPLTLGWNFDPKCLQGLCRRIEWHDLHNRKMRGVLVRDGARYTGTYTGFFYTTCQGTRRSSSVEIELRVSKAQTVGGEWHATRLRGTIGTSGTAQLGCVSTRMTQAVKGRLHPSSL